jgi:phage repressor protein C with HTH and peptisase S24 domain
MSRRLRIVRKHLKLTQKELAESIKEKWFKIKDIELEKNTLTSDIADKVRMKYGISFDWLLTGKGEMFPKKGEITEKEEENSYGIEVLNIRAGAGEGIYNYEISTVDKIYLDKNLFKTKPNIEKLKIIEVDGDSMTPTLISGDRVIIDESKNNYIDGIYAILLNNQVLIKRLQFKMNGDIKIISDNKNYDSQTYSEAENQIPFKIIGMKTFTITNS